MADMQSYANTKGYFGERTFTSLETILDDPTQLLMSSRVGPSVAGAPDILSASRYPHALMQPYEEMNTNFRKRKASDQLYGGIILSGNASDGASSSAEPEQEPPVQKRKRSARAKSNDNDDIADNKKSRGRPRMDTQDETAADRRRTQIRLAQRAYRHRKETTISALKTRVTDLQISIEQMNKTFLALHDNMIDAGIHNTHYTLARQIEAAQEEFERFAKLAAAESDDEGEQIARLTKDASEPSEAGEKQRGIPARQKASQKTTKANVRRPKESSQNATDIEADVEELPLIKQPQSNDFMSFYPSSAFEDAANLTGLNNLMAFDVSIPNDPLPTTFKTTIERPLVPNTPSLAPSYTYSFQETTFARRLHRLCLERAFRNLTNPQIDPGYIQRAFRFTFCFSNRKRMLERFQQMLRRRAGESLENWNVPFFHIGGAGTHFPRRDEEGNAVYPPNMVSPAKAFGPQQWVQAETPRLETSTQDMLEAIGFGGEWYDSHDVEEYLKTKGIYLDGQSSFVEVDAAVVLRAKESIVVSSNSSASGRSGSTADNNAPRTPAPFNPTITDPFLGANLDMPNDYFGDVPELDNNNTKGVAGDAFDDFDWNLNQSPGYTPTFSDLLTRRQGPVSFDVEAFLERMVDGSACLGRAPGFRKENIDRALVLSLQEAF